MKSKKIVRQWWFWMAIVFIVFCTWCLLEKDEGQSSLGNKQIVLDLDLDEWLGGDTSVKSVNAEMYEEEYGIAYFEGILATDYAQALCEAAGGMDYAESWEEYGYLVSTYMNDNYYIYIEADVETDEIHYIQVSILDWEAVGENADIFEIAAELLGYETFCGEALEDDIDTFYELLEDFEQMTKEGSTESSCIIIYESSCVQFFMDDYGYPTFEIIAYDDIEAV